MLLTVGTIARPGLAGAHRLLDLGQSHLLRPAQVSKTHNWEALGSLRAVQTVAGPERDSEGQAGCEGLHREPGNLKVPGRSRKAGDC